MQIDLIIHCESPAELEVIASVLSATEFGVTAANELEAEITAAETEQQTLVVTVPNVSPDTTVKTVPAEPKKARGRPKKPKTDEVRGAAVLDQLKASVAEPVSNVVPMKKPDPIEDAVFGVPDTAPADAAPSSDIKTGQQLQEYILSFVHQKRLDPNVVKSTIYPKYGVIRSLDLSADQVPLAKADVDAMLKGEKPAAANDLDL